MSDFHRGLRSALSTALVASCLVPAAFALQDPLADPRPEKRVGARGTRPGDLVVEAPHARFDDRYQGESVEHAWTVVNSGDVDVTVERALSVDGTGRVEMVPRVLASGERAVVTVEQPLGDQLGESSFRYALISDEPGVARYRFSLSGFVQSAFDPEVLELRFPPSADETPRAAAEVGSREVERLEIRRAVDPPPWLEVGWSATGERPDDPLEVEARLLPSSPVGIVGGSFALETNVVHQPLLWVRYSGAVYRELLPETNPVALGAVDVGGEQVSAVQVRRVSAGPLARLEASSDHPWVSARVEACEQPADACRSLRLRFTPQQPGPLTATVTVRAPGIEELPIRVHGIGVAPGTRVRQLDLGGEGEVGGVDGEGGRVEDQGVEP